jgi:hypothetical protein
MHDAPQSNRLSRPTPAKAVDSLVALAMERFNGTLGVTAAFLAAFCEIHPPRCEPLFDSAWVNAAFAFRPLISSAGLDLFGESVNPVPPSRDS